MREDLMSKVNVENSAQSEVRELSDAELDVVAGGVVIPVVHGPVEFDYIASSKQTHPDIIFTPNNVIAVGRGPI
jgi:hypothetical protein